MKEPIVSMAVSDFLQREAGPHRLCVLCNTVSAIGLTGDVSRPIGVAKL